MPGYQVRFQTIAVGSTDFRIRSLLDRQQYHDPDGEAEAAGERGLNLTMLCDADGSYARVCGVQYEMSAEHADLYRRFGLDLDRLNAGAGWSLPIPATYVVGPDGVITFAFAEVDWARRAEPAELLAAVERLEPATDPG